MAQKTLNTTALVDGYDSGDWRPNAALQQAMNTELYSAIKTNALTTVFAGDSLAVQQGIPPGMTSYSSFMWGNMLTGMAWEVIGNTGVNGLTTAQWLATGNLAATIALKPTAVDFFLGNNDANGSTPVATTVAGLLQAYQAFAAAGIYVRDYSLLPRNDSSTKSQVGLALAVNAFKRDYWRNNPNGEYLDAYSQVVNPLSSTLTTLNQHNNDGVIHPDTQGAWLIGLYVVAPALSRWGTAALILPTSVMEDTGQQTTGQCLSTNPLMQGTGGTNSTNSTGTVATGVTTIGSTNVALANTTPARADGYGNDQQVAMTASAAGTAIIQMPVAATLTNLVLGRPVFAVLEWNYNANPTGLNGLQFALAASGAAFPVAPFINAQGTGAAWTPTVAKPLTVRTQMAYPQSGLTNMFMNITANFTGAGAATVRFGRFAIYQRPF